MKLDFSFKNKRAPQKGRVIVADPFSKGDYFERSVVYLCEHNEEGTFGFVLDKYLDFNLSDIAKNFPEIDTRISVGGPVQTESIFFLHTLGERIEGSMEVGNGIYMGGDYDSVIQGLRDESIQSSEVRFFLGYSGWDPNQLEDEISRNNWIVSTVTNVWEIMDTSLEDLWQRFMKREGKKYEILSKAPIDFIDN
ncbi:MAG: YqgE/AlgH family protein [Brumimicrobium sp.]|nr:YqgE/AlgH family protein [Brumimicrobium sp.]